MFIKTRVHMKSLMMSLYESTREYHKSKYGDICSCVTSYFFQSTASMMSGFIIHICEGHGKEWSVFAGPYTSEDVQKLSFDVREKLRRVLEDGKIKLAEREANESLPQEQRIQTSPISYRSN